MLENAGTDSSGEREHGGARAGAGRPLLGQAGPKEKWSTRLDPVVLLRLERLGQAYSLSKAAVVEKLVQEAHRRLYDELSQEELRDLDL